MARLNPPLEKEISRQIQDFLEYQGCFVIRLANIPTPLPGGGFRRALKVGLPDLLAYIPRKKGFAVPVAIEVKRQGCKPTPAQEQVLSDLDHMGVVTIVASSLEFVQKTLAKFLQ